MLDWSDYHVVEVVQGVATKRRLSDWRLLTACRAGLQPRYILTALGINILLLVLVLLYDDAELWLKIGRVNGRAIIRFRLLQVLLGSAASQGAPQWQLIKPLMSSIELVFVG